MTSDVGGIDCGATCVSGDLAHDTHVILTAHPDLGSAIAGWDYGTCGSAPTCDVTMDADHTVTADFEPAFDLTITPAGTGGGTVTSTPNNEISCPSTCNSSFAENSSVTLHAVADGNSAFTGWSGDTAGGQLPHDRRLRRHDGSGTQRDGDVHARLGAPGSAGWSGWGHRHIDAGCDRLRRRLR